MLEVDGARVVPGGLPSPVIARRVPWSGSGVSKTRRKAGPKVVSERGHGKTALLSTFHPSLQLSQYEYEYYVQEHLSAEVQNYTTLKLALLHRLKDLGQLVHLFRLEMSLDHAPVS
jgi:hypothetical protein